MFRGVLAAVIGMCVLIGLGVFQVVQGQSGTQLVITMNLAAPVKLAGGSYYMAFTVDDTILTGPQSDSSNWTHYVVYRQGRFLFGLVPVGPLRPFAFETIRPPEPYAYGDVSTDRRTLKARLPLTNLQTGPALPAQIKVNFVTVDELLRPLDALGVGPADRFGFVVLDLRKATYLAVTHTARNCPDPAFCITGGDLQLTTP